MAGVCFLVDSSCSMSKLLELNTISSLDIAKAAVESFLQTILKHNVVVPLLLVNSDDNRGCILSGLGESFTYFEDKLKNMSSSDTNGDFSYALSLVFSIINKSRLKNNTDQFGYGMIPWQIEPYNIIVITDMEGLERNQVLFQYL